MNFNLSIKLGPTNDPCLRIADFGQCHKGMADIEFLLLIGFIIVITYILLPLIKTAFINKFSVSTGFTRFWVIALISCIVTLYSVLFFPMFAQPYEYTSDDKVGSLIIKFKDKADYQTGYVTPYYINYVCFFLYDFLYMYIISAVIDIFAFSQSKLARIYNFILKVFYVVYTAITLGNVIFSINFFADLWGKNWLWFAYNFNFVIHPSVILFFYIACSTTFIFTNDSDWLYTRSFQIIMRAMVLIIMILTIIQTTFAIYMFHMKPNALAVGAALNYPKWRSLYLNAMLFYDFLCFILPLMCFVTMMIIMTRIKEGESNTDVSTMTGQEVLDEPFIP